MTPSREALEAAARKIAAMKMGLEKDPDGLRLPDDLWRQALPQAEAALTAAYARDFPQPSESDAAILEQTLDECEAIARKQESHTSGWMAASRNIAVAIATLKRKGYLDAKCVAIQSIAVRALITDWRWRGDTLDVLEKELDVLSASHKDLAHRVARMGEALRAMIYEATSLSPMEDDGSHWCRITKEALELARAAYHGADAIRKGT